MADLPIKVDTKGGPRGRTAGPMEVANRAVDPAEAETSPGPGLMLASIQGGGAPASRHCPSQTSVVWGAPRHIHLLIFAITHHIRTWGPTSTSNWVPTCTCITCCIQYYICVGSEQVYLSSVLRWCHAPEHHARSPAPARPASLLLHDAPAHVPPALTIRHQRSAGRT